MILNPNAAKESRRATQFDRIVFFQRRIPVRTRPDTEPREAIVLAAQATKDGRRLIVAAGATCTFNEVVDGVMRAVENWSCPQGMLRL